jgi:hypothetical protein
MAAKPSWEDRAWRFLKAELARADIRYSELAETAKKAWPVGNRSEDREQDQPVHVLCNISARIAHRN